MYVWPDPFIQLAGRPDNVTPGVQVSPKFTARPRGGKETNFGPHPLLLAKTWHMCQGRVYLYQDVRGIYTPDIPKKIRQDSG